MNKKDDFYSQKKKFCLYKNFFVDFFSFYYNLLMLKSMLSIANNIKLKFHLEHYWFCLYLAYSIAILLPRIPPPFVWPCMLAMGTWGATPPITKSILVKILKSCKINLLNFYEKISERNKDEKGVIYKVE